MFGSRRGGDGRIRMRVNIPVGDVSFITWSYGYDSVHDSWIIRIINGHVGRKGGGATSCVIISSVGGDIYDRDIVIYRWWLVVVRRRVIFIDI